MLKKAKLVEIKWDTNQANAEPVSGGKSVTVQFNPQSLRISFSNKNQGGDQPGGSTRQFVGSGTTKLSVELLFDTTSDGKDVRQYTQAIAFFVQAKKEGGSNSNRVPPGLRFQWGSLIFDGIVDSMDETLDYFSDDGVPLRATISLGVSRQEIEFIPGEKGKGGGGGAPTQENIRPLKTARPGDSVQSLAARDGKSNDWKGIAAANNIDDPLRLPAGALVDVKAGAKIKTGLSGGASGSASAGISVDASAITSASLSGSISAGTRTGARRR
ncbi:MAG TPA: hypothetical protein VM911_14515 [Pyrinomonadaceae bacterium]|jgi:hypothetical protein|nr:hypothetical protein [Pyrinomonadaceae bacterium]